MPRQGKFQASYPYRYDNHADDYEQKSECGFQAAAGRQQGAAPAHQRLPRKPSQPQERKRCSDAESEHRQRNLTEVLSLCREQRCGSKRGSHTRTPYGTQEHADPELPREAVGLFCCELAVSPVSNGSSGGRKADLKGWEQQYAPPQRPPAPPQHSATGPHQARSNGQPSPGTIQSRQTTEIARRRAINMKRSRTRC